VDLNPMGVGFASVHLTLESGINWVFALTDLFTSLVAEIRGGFGAVTNRLNSAISSAQHARENLSAAESRIRDADIAFETAALTKALILQQAAIAVLAQAQVQPSLALTLLER